MTYHGETKKYPPIGLKPTAEDRAFVLTLSIIGTPVRDICLRLQERFNLVRPMSRMTLYHHFREQLVNTAKGRRPLPKTMTKTLQRNIQAEMFRLLTEAAERAKAK